MLYENIIFDFGNVIGEFDGRKIMRQFCSSPEGCDILCKTIYARWTDLDKGILDYSEYERETICRLPCELQEAARSFFRKWPEYLQPVTDTLELINLLYKKNVSMYLLSNAPTFFADWAENYPVLEKFKGVVFSAPLKMAKPDPDIYNYLFDTYSLDPHDCFFIDDLEQNIIAGKSLGMNGIVFDGNINKVKASIGL